MATNTVGAGAYNDFSQFSTLSYNCIKHLLIQNELIWKLLKYTDPDAWKEDDLTHDEKAALIYAGQQDTSEYYVFMDGKQPDVLTKESTMLRIMPYYAVGMNRTVGFVEISMEVYSHYKINHMSNYKTRVDTIAEELLATFNGSDVGGLGRMFFSKMGDQSSRLFQVGQIPFGGKQIIFATYSA